MASQDGRASVVGPGLGRDPTMSEIAKRIIAFAHERDVPLVIDADGLRVLMEDQGLIGGPGHVVLTPNKAELGRFSAQIAGSRGDPPPDDDDGAGAIRHESTRRPGRRGERGGGHRRVGRHRRVHRWASNLVIDVISSATSRDRRGDAGAKATCSPGRIATFLAWATRSKEAERAIARRIDVEDDHVDGGSDCRRGRRTGYETHPSLARPL